MGMPIRPDQVYDPPAAVTPPSPSAGIIRAREVIIFGTSGGLFVYNGNPGPGTLVYSVTEASTDPFGNPTDPIAAVYGSIPAGGSVPQSIVEQITAGVASINFNSGAGSEGQAAQITETIRFGNTNSEQVLFQIFGPQNSTNKDGLAIWIADSIQATAETCSLFLNYIDTAATAHSLLIGTPRGLQMPLTQTLVGAQPGTHGTGITEESWHTITPVSGFSQGSPVPRYRYEPIGPSGLVRLAGSIHLTATKGAGTAFFTLPTGYVPQHSQFFFTTSSLTGTTLGSATLAVGGTIDAPAEAGQLQINVNGVSGQTLFLDGVPIPLD